MHYLSYLRPPVCLPRGVCLSPSSVTATQDRLGHLVCFPVSTIVFPFYSLSAYHIVSCLKVKSGDLKLA